MDSHDCWGSLVLEWTRALRAENKAPKTVDVYVSSTRQFLDWLRRQPGAPTSPEAIGSAAQILERDRKKPDTASLRTRSWKQLTNEWRPTVITPNDPASRRATNQSAINALRDQIAELREDNRDLALDRQDERRREDEVHRRSASDSRGAYESVESDGGESRTSGLGY